MAIDLTDSTQELAVNYVRIGRIVIDVSTNNPNIISVEWEQINKTGGVKTYIKPGPKIVIQNKKLQKAPDPETGDMVVIQEATTDMTDLAQEVVTYKGQQTTLYNLISYLLNKYAKDNGIFTGTVEGA